MKLILFLIFICMTVVFSAQSKTQKTFKDQAMTKKNLSWFELKNCDTLEINDFAKLVDAKPLRSKVFTDKAVITQLRSMIETLPSEGPMMKSFGDEVPVIVLVFKCGEKTESVEFYRGKIKTPSTGFYSEKTPDEDMVFSYIQNLLKN